jgi:hypothetical protein
LPFPNYLPFVSESFLYLVFPFATPSFKKLHFTDKMKIWPSCQSKHTLSGGVPMLATDGPRVLADHLLSQTVDAHIHGFPLHCTKILLGEGDGAAAIGNYLFFKG